MLVLVLRMLIELFTRCGGLPISGPVASIAVNCVGCRLTTMFGGLLSSAALIACTYSPNVDIFILVFGGFGGKNVNQHLSDIFSKMVYEVSNMYKSFLVFNSSVDIN